MNKHSRYVPDKVKGSHSLTVTYGTTCISLFAKNKKKMTDEYYFNRGLYPDSELLTNVSDIMSCNKSDHWTENKLEPALQSEILPRSNQVGI